jgi:hypothetical protein
MITGCRESQSLRWVGCSFRGAMLSLSTNSTVLSTKSMPLRHFQWSLQTFLACTFLVASTCGGLVALKFDLYFSPFLELPMLLIFLLLLTHNALFVSWAASFRCRWL